MASNRLLALFALAFFFSGASAEISVEIRPASGEGVLGLYPYETGVLVTSLKNYGAASEGRISIKWDAGEGLAISEGIGGVSDSTTYSIDGLAAGEEKRIEIRVKPVDSKKAKGDVRLLSVSYGKGSYDYFAGTHVRVLAPVLQADASISEKTLKPGSSGEINLSIKNISENEIRINSARLVLPPSFFAGNSPEFGETILAAGSEIRDKKLEFGTEKDCAEEGTILLRIEFEDSIGVHAIEKDFRAECRSANYGLLPYIALVALLIILLFYVKQREFEKKKKKARTAAEAKNS